MFLGIDPGRCKCGWALVRADGGLCLSGAVPSELPREWAGAFSLPAREMAGALAFWTRECVCPPVGEPEEEISSIILGNGTGSENIEQQLRTFFEFDILIRQEKFTTLAARSLYWKLHPPRFLWKIVPTSLRVPPRDVDDLAAWAIVLQMIKEGE